MGYRMVHGGSGVTFPAVVRASHYHGAGILLDQAEKKLDVRTESGRDMLGFILPSYRRRSKYVVAHKDDQKKTMAYKNFGFKAFASERGLDKALNSRCVIFIMERKYPSIAKLSQVQIEIDILQTQLLNYKYRYSPPEPLPDSYPLKGRIREIFEPIIATGEHIGLDTSEIEKFAMKMESEKDSDLEDSDEWQILNYIRECIENNYVDAPEAIKYSEK
jgi:hypothetical protein